jgi:hypothetical protein
VFSGVTKITSLVTGIVFGDAPKEHSDIDNHSNTNRTDYQR